jgi:hypothetical protein
MAPMVLWLQWLVCSMAVMAQMAQMACKFYGPDGFNGSDGAIQPFSVGMYI